MHIECTEWPTYQDWCAVKERTLITVGKKPTTDPHIAWKRRLLEARHSPIRRLRFAFRLEGIPSYVAVHLCRHVHGQPYVRSQRNDRQQEYDRTKAPQDTPVDMIWDLNAEELMVVANKRLCGQADPKTREIVQMICDEAVGHCPEFDGFLVPLCQYHGGVCHEFFPCGRASDGKN